LPTPSLRGLIAQRSKFVSRQPSPCARTRSTLACWRRIGDREHFRQVVAAGRAQTPFSRTDEQFDIFLCRI
jgi:hypothetical protein